MTPASAPPPSARARRVWSGGHYDRIAAGFRHEARAFVERCALRPGQQVLDAACGSGNLTVPAARTGAAVTGVDLVASHLAAAAAWAAHEGLAPALDQGSVEALPYADGRFDVVLSMFGVMFAARPARAVAELARVTRPGGRVVLATWTRGGFFGRMFALHAAALPLPPAVPSPLLWGDEDVLRAWFDARAWRLTTTPRAFTLRYPHTPAGTAELFRAAFGPTARALAALDEDRRAELAADLAVHWAWHARAAAAGAATEVAAEYLEVTAVRRGGEG